MLIKTRIPNKWSICIMIEYSASISISNTHGIFYLDAPRIPWRNVSFFRCAFIFALCVLCYFLSLCQSLPLQLKILNPTHCNLLCAPVKYAMPAFWQSSKLSKSAQKKNEHKMKWIRRVCVCLIFVFFSRVFNGLPNRFMWRLEITFC